jgi:hypothetical protein
MTNEGHKRLADFIRQNEAPIVKEWIEFARTISPASDKMSKLALEDHIVDILGFVADDQADFRRSSAGSIPAALSQSAVALPAGVTSNASSSESRPGANARASRAG